MMGRESVGLVVLQFTAQAGHTYHLEAIDRGNRWRPEMIDTVSGRDVSEKISTSE
jgi:hypothetical protein